MTDKNIHQQLSEIIDILATIAENTKKPIMTAKQRDEYNKRMNTPHSQLPYDWD